MALNASGPISLGGSTAGQSIALELNLSATGQISLNDAAVRTLAQVASGAIVMPTNFWGKANTPTGELYSWGYNLQGEMGNNTRSTTTPTYPQATPTLTFGGNTWTSVVPGYFGVKSDGTMWSWGAADDALAGTNQSSIIRSSPVQIGALTNWKQVSMAKANNGFAVKTDGTLWVWGNQGAINGLNNPIPGTISSPVQIGALTDWSFVAAGPSDAGAIKTNNTLWTWGRNQYGETGQNQPEIVEISSPTQVGSLTNWKAISFDNESGQLSGAVKTDGTLWAIGGNVKNYGSNSGAYTSSPTQIGSLTDWDYVSRFLSNGAAWIKTNGTWWTCGNNYSGQLGQNNRTNTSSPVQVGALTTWNYTAKARACTLASKTDGTLWGMGSNSYGQLGATGVATGNPGGSRSSPVQIGTATTWKIVFGTGDLNSGGLQ